MHVCEDVAAIGGQGKYLRLSTVGKRHVSTTTLIKEIISLGLAYSFRGLVCFCHGGKPGCSSHGGLEGADGMTYFLQLGPTSYLAPPVDY